MSPGSVEEISANGREVPSSIGGRRGRVMSRPFGLCFMREAHRKLRYFPQGCREPACEWQGAGAPQEPIMKRPVLIIVTAVIVAAAAAVGLAEEGAGSTATLEGPRAVREQDGPSRACVVSGAVRGTARGSHRRCRPDDTPGAVRGPSVSLPRRA